MRRTAATVAALALVLAPASAAHAGSTTKKDKDDTSSVLDLRKVSLKTKGKKVVVTLTTHGAWSDADIAATTAGLSVDFRKSRTQNRSVLVAAYDGTIGASICTLRTSDLTSTSCSALPLERVSATSVRVTIPRATIIKGAKAYRWKAGSYAAEGEAGCTDAFCLDALPRDKDAWYTWRP